MNSLEKFAGIRPDNRVALDKDECPDTTTGRVEKNIKSGVQSAEANRASLHVVMTQAPAEIPVQATMKLPESLWIRAKVRALQQRKRVSDYVRALIEADLEAEQPAKRKREEGK